MIRSKNKLLVLAMVVGMILVVLFVVATAHAETDESWYFTDDGISIHIWHQGQFDGMVITKTFPKEDIVFEITIHDHPERTPELEQALAFFGIHNAFNRANGLLNYLNVLVELGLEETNI